MSALRILALFVSVACTAAGQPPGALPPIVFDDFDYENTSWAEDSGLDPTLNAGSLFGWNQWARSLDGSFTSDRLWYRAFGWWEPEYARPDLVRIVDAGAIAGIEQGGLLLDAPAGYTTAPPGRADPEILSGFTARYGTWAARINFSDVDDVRGLMQSFWTVSSNVAIVRDGDGTLKKAWSEVDHEFNNWFHTLWTRDPEPGRTLATQYISDQGNVFVATGFIEGMHRQVVSLRGLAEPGGQPLPDYHCKLVRNETEVYRLSPASCAALIAGDYPQMVYGLPVLDRDIATNLLIRHDGNEMVFELQAAWSASAPDGTGTDAYRLLMASQPYTPPAGAPLPSQRMTTRFSQLGVRGTHGETRFGDRPLMRDHPMVVDWFYYSPDASLTLDAVAAQVEEIRARNIPRLNTLERPLHRPYRKPGNIAEWPYMEAEHEAAVFLEGPDEVAPGARPAFVGHYADRQGELRLVWQVRQRTVDGTFSPWDVLAEDVWFRHSVPFPAAGPPAFEVQLRAGEYPTLGDWTQPPNVYVSRTLTYTWDASTRRFHLTGSR